MHNRLDADNGGMGVGRDATDSTLTTGDRNRIRTEDGRSQNVSVQLSGQADKGLLTLEQRLQHAEKRINALEQYLTQMENIVYGAPRIGIPGVLEKLKLIEAIINDIQTIVQRRAEKAEKVDWRLLGYFLGGVLGIVGAGVYAILQVAR